MKRPRSGAERMAAYRTRQQVSALVAAHWVEIHWPENSFARNQLGRELIRSKPIGPKTHAPENLLA